MENTAIRGIVDVNKPCEPVIYSTALIRFLEEEKGISSEAVLENTTISQEVLEDPDGLITPTQRNAIVSNALRLTGEPDLGLQFGRQLKISSHGFLGFAVMSASSLMEGIQLMLKYFKTRTQMLEIYYSIEDNHAVIRIEEAILLEDLHPFAVESMFVCIYENAIAMLDDTGDNNNDVEARFSYPEPEYGQKYNIDSPIRLSFGRSANEIRFPLSMLDKPLVLADPTNSKLAESQCEKELEQTETSESILAKVRRLLTQDPGHFPNLEKVAESCNTSPRTLKRRLKLLNTSYQEILDNVRKQIAADHLLNSDKTVDEIARLLGYNDPSNFGRAFKKWTGTSPSGFRESKGQNQPLA